MDHDEMRNAMNRATDQIPTHDNGRFILWQADCREALARLDDNSVDAIVTDPPYELGFMGKTWDASGIAYNVEMWREALRVLKPGGHLLAFGGSRTYHRLACAIEDAGFEIRDQIMWVYGSGFPKSLDVSKAIDKMAGAEREVVGTDTKARSTAGSSALPTVGGTTVYQTWDLTAPATDAAKQWNGWGTALKPAHEPIVVARKPLEGTVAANVLKWGTGALNIDGTRVGDEVVTTHRPAALGYQKVYGKFAGGPSTPHAGRWPANFIHDGSDEVLELFPETKGQVGMRKTQGGHRFIVGDTESVQKFDHGTTDSGSAARFFYCAKASKAERNAGLGHLPTVIVPTVAMGSFDHGTLPDGTPREMNPLPRANHHPTVKPVALMRYLIRLVTPPGGVVLDPFAGSGTTMVAALMEGVTPWGCEMTEDYIPIILGRIQWALDEVDSRIAGTL